MFKTTTLAALAIAFAAPSYAVTMSAYDTVNGTAISAGINGAGVTSADLVRGAGVTEVGNANHFRSRDWTVGGNVATAMANNDYLEWGFSSTSTYNLDTLSIRYNRNNNGPTSVAIFASYDGGAFSQIFLDSSVDTSAETNAINLGGVAVDGATFRLFGWGANRANGRFLVRQNGVGPGNDYGIALTGDIAVVPLPASLPILAGALGLFGLVRRKI
jgi:hypothetical protein